MFLCGPGAEVELRRFLFFIYLQGYIFISFKISRATFFSSLFIIPLNLFPVESFKILPTISAFLEWDNEFCFKMQTVDFQLRGRKSENNGNKRSENPSGESQSCVCIFLNFTSKIWLKSDDSERLSRSL